MEDAEEVRKGRGEALELAVREDLELFAVEDLETRIDLLEAEIERCRAHIRRKAIGRQAADALFRNPDA
ncbi:MAG: DUF1192 family protein [Phenylobacterium sp.]